MSERLRNEEIEELANFLCSMETYDHAECEKCGKWDYGTCDELCFSQTVASDLYNAGYRKVSDVAREIFHEIEEEYEVFDDWDEISFGTLRKDLYKIIHKRLGEWE